MRQVGKLLKRNNGIIVLMKIIQCKLQAFKLRRACWHRLQSLIFRIPVCFRQKSGENLTEKSLDPKLVTERLFRVEPVDLIQHLKKPPGLRSGSVRLDSVRPGPIDPDAGAGTALQKRAHALALHIAADFSADKFRCSDDAAVQNTLSRQRMAAVRNVASDQNSRSRRNRIAFLIDLTDRSSLSRKTEFNFIMPVDRDISSLKHPQIIVIDRDRKCLCAMRRKPHIFSLFP